MWQTFGRQPKSELVSYLVDIGCGLVDTKQSEDEIVTVVKLKTNWKMYKHKHKREETGSSWCKVRWQWQWELAMDWALCLFRRGENGGKRSAPSIWILTPPTCFPARPNNRWLERRRLAGGQKFILCGAKRERRNVNGIFCIMFYVFISPLFAEALWICMARHYFVLHNPQRPTVYWQEKMQCSAADIEWMNLH